MVSGLVLVPVVSLLTKNTLPDNIEEIFTCYNENKTVGITDHLGK